MNKFKKIFNRIFVNPKSGRFKSMDQKDKYIWALAELRPWLRDQICRSYYSDFCHKVNCTTNDIVLYKITGKDVSIVFKPEEVENNLSATIIERREIYLKLFHETIANTEYHIDCLLPVCVDDRDPDPVIFPIFSFQKNDASKSILIPDPDFYYFNYYDFNMHVDTINYDNKLDGAIFVGSTTGKSNISIKDIENGCIQRINSALFFRKVSGVNFVLPKVVQCIDKETEDYIYSLGIISTEHLTWKDQFKYKYIISMDGNGACCSRIIISMKSNSILLKYQSRSQLYYFKFLQPWVHYIPIERDQDVGFILDLNKQEEFKIIPQNARQFVELNLNRSSVIKYMENVLYIFNGLMC